MAEIATIARPYAEAAFGIADKEGSLDQWSARLAALALAVRTEELQQILGNPLVKPEQFVDMLLAVAEQSTGTVSAELRNLLSTLAENDRLQALPSVAEQFEALKNERQGAVDAVIETAFPFRDADLQSLVGDLERRFRRKVRPQVKVDQNLIGGARITVGDQVIDGSVRGKLAALQAGLTQS
jgi:F-type H+-transporting ATPase subunit delta